MHASIGFLVMCVTVCVFAESGSQQCHWLALEYICWDPAAETDWNCDVTQHLSLVPGLNYTTYSCTLLTFPPPWNESLWLVGPVNVRVLTVDLTVPTLRLVPGTADPTVNYGLGSLDHIATYANGGTTPNLLAGVNGGYFYRLDSKDFNDFVCFGKDRDEALAPVDPNYPSQGVGDTMARVDGVNKSFNCDNLGLSRPAILAIETVATQSYITVVERAGTVPNSVLNAIAAGPNLVSLNDQGVPVVNIPEDDDNVNVDEHVANTGVGLLNNGATALLVTVDGWDGCDMLNSTCGMNAPQLAFLMKDFLSVQYAMEMDQGGSTTMWVKGVGSRNGVVSNTCPGGHEPGFCHGAGDKGAGGRSIANGLFVQAV